MAHCSGDPWVRQWTGGPRVHVFAWSPDMSRRRYFVTPMYDQHLWDPRRSRIGLLLVG